MVEQIYWRVSKTKNMKFMNSLPGWTRHRLNRSPIGWFQREINHGLYIPNIAGFLLVPSWLQRKALVGWYEYCCMLQQLKNNKNDQEYTYIFCNSLGRYLHDTRKKRINLYARVPMTPVEMAGMRWSILVPCLARRRFRMARATSTHVITMITASMATVTAATVSVEERPPPPSCSGYPRAGGGGEVGVSVVVDPGSFTSSLAIFHWRDGEFSLCFST